MPRNPGYQTGLNDVFDFVQNAGQDAIDAVAGVVGIEKGSDIDKAITTAAGIGREVTGVDTVGGVIDKITGGGKTTATTATTPPASGPSFIKQVSIPWALAGGAGVGLGMHLAFKKLWLTILSTVVGGVGIGIVGPKLMGPKTGTVAPNPSR